MHRPPTLTTAMTPFPYAIDRGASLDAAYALMGEHDVRHLPVTDGGAIVGVISDRDLNGIGSLQGVGASLTVGDVMVTEPYIVDLNEHLDTVLLTMARRHMGSAVVTRGGKLAGMFTAVDACRVFGEFLAERFPHGGDDIVA